MNFKVIWEDDIMTTFFKGTSLSFNSLEGSVNFRNPYIAAGTSIVKWQSNITYNQSRTSLQLPLLKKGTVYELRSDLSLTPSNTLLIKLSFYDRSGKRVGLIAFESDGGVFIYPKDAYFYDIELINVGVESLIFKSLTLSEYQGDGENRSSER